MTKKMSIAQEIERRIVRLSDPKVKWVRGVPHRRNESCILRDGGAGEYTPTGQPVFSERASRWLDGWWDFATMADVPSGLGRWPDAWNDTLARNVRQVVDMLADAWEDAREEGA